MRRPRRSSITGISDTWNYRLRTVDDSFDFSREFTDKLNQEMLDEERIERKHKQEADQRQEPPQPSSDLSDKPEAQ